MYSTIDMACFEKIQVSKHNNYFQIARRTFQ